MPNFTFDGYDGINSLGDTTKKIEMVECPAIGSTSNNNEIPKASCLTKQKDPSLPTCYPSCYATRQYKGGRMDSWKQDNDIKKDGKMTVEERRVSKMSLAGVSQRDIAHCINRAPSHVCNIIKRLRQRGILPEKVM